MKPEEWRQRMSGMPSPLKSPTPSMVQSEVTEPSGTELLMVVPFMSQRLTGPPDELRQRMSAVPLPLKSRTPRTDQLVPGAGGGGVGELFVSTNPRPALSAAELLSIKAAELTTNPLPEFCSAL